MRSAVMFVTLLFATAASAQDIKPPPQSAPQAMPSTVGSAPVGHRQPRLSDLPPDIAKQEKSDAQTRMDRLVKDPDLDRRLRICSGC